jgi:hypothetical protein
MRKLENEVKNKNYFLCSISWKGKEGSWYTETRCNNHGVREIEI